MATPIETVTAFLAEWSKSAEALRSSYRDYFTAATVWENVGMVTTTGIEEALALMEQFESGQGVKTVHVDMINIAAAGDIVLTERVDRGITADGKEVMTIRLMGVFEVAGDKIVRWRDYFDNVPFSNAS
jgi:limonene-1,2-epoxide hydrolase